MVFTETVRAWEDEYAEFVSVYSGRLRRLAYGRCGSWETADRLTRKVLLSTYRRGGSTHELPEAYAERTMHRLLRRETGTFPTDGPAPVAPFTAADLVKVARGRRRRLRAVTALVTVLAVVAGGVGFHLLRPVPGGVPITLDEVDCMEGLLGPADVPTPASTLADLVPPDDAGLDRLTALTGDLPLRGATVMPEQLRREQLSCEIAGYFRAKVNPDAVERVELGLDDRGDVRPLAALLDPNIGPAALTVSVRVYSPSGFGTATISVAPTTSRPGPEHCARLPFCQLSSVFDDRVVEQYGARESPETLRAGHRLGKNAEWWSVASYSGHTMVLVTITNTPDIWASLPASTLYAPLGEQVVTLATDPRLAVFDPPASSGPPSSP